MGGCSLSCRAGCRATNEQEEKPALEHNLAVVYVDGWDLGSWRFVHVLVVLVCKPVSRAGMACGQAQFS